MKKFSIIKSLLPLLLILNVASFAEDSIVSERSALSSKLQGLTQDDVSFTAAQDGIIKFISTKQGASIQQPFNGVASSNPTEVAINFLTEYKSLFGKQYKAEYTLIKDTLTGTRHSVKLQQNFKGIPVFAGEMVVRLNQSLDVTGANGIITSKLELSTKPLIDKETAKQNAIVVAQKLNTQNGIGSIAMTASEPTLWIYNPKLLGKKGGINKLAWRMNVSDVSHMKSDQYIFIDAITGNPLNSISNIYDAKNRSIHDLNNVDASGITPPGPLTRAEGQAATGITDVDNAYDFLGDTYDFYLTTHNRDSVDNAGMTLVATVRYCPNVTDCPYGNAAWSSTLNQMVFGEGFTVDDVTGHEVTHGVTSRTSNLVYQDQSGAINESFSDVWGEFIDLSNSAGKDTPPFRWLMGEDLGAIRYMRNPPQFNDPDKITSQHYYCGSGDSGGVHTNSGVNNKAAYLMVDGDTFNGFTINGIGITKTAKIYYEAQTNILTSGSTYPDLYTALNSACNTLIGTAGITAANCTEVKKALDAVEMFHPPCSGPLPIPICPSGESPNYLVNEGFESGLNGWTHSAVTGPDAWTLSTTSPKTGAKHIHGADVTTTSDSSIRSNLSLNLPADAYLRFTHGGRFENNLDGGVVEYTTDGGTTWNDTATMFTHNEYNGTLFSGTLGSSRQAFTGNFMPDSYYSSHIDLSSLVGATVDFRFRVGTDGSVGYSGWNIDDVEVYTCGQASSPTITSPASQSTLTGSTETFTWNYNGTLIQQWAFYVGSTVGAKDYLIRGGSNYTTSVTAIGLPKDSSTIYTRLWYKTNGVWGKIDTTYTASSPTPAIVSPTPNTTLAGVNQTFTWDYNGISVSQWALYAGSSLGAKDYSIKGALGGATSTMLTGLPNNGSTVYIRFWYKENGTWNKIDATYTAIDTVTSEIINPVAASTMAGTTQTFTWNYNGISVSQWALYAGSSLGAKDYSIKGALGSATSTVVNDLPADGSTIYIRLWYKKVNGTWGKIDETYTAVLGPQIITPTDGGTLIGHSQLFTWDYNGTTIQQWALYAGSAVGAKNYFFTGGTNGAVTSVTATGLPQNGSTIYVRLWYRLTSGAWNKLDVTYTARDLIPAITSPAPGSTLTGSSQVFTWDLDYSHNSSGYEQHAFQLGSTLGGSDYHSSNGGYVTGLPTDGSTIYARLWYKYSGTWYKVDETYTASQ